MTPPCVGSAQPPRAAAVGLLLASRRHLKHGIVELASLHHGDAAQLNVEDDIHSTKLGLALSAFGTIIWGWGSYLGWWSFLFVPVWSLFVLRDAWRDQRHLDCRASNSRAPA